MRKAGERAYLSRQIWIHPFCPNYTCSLNGRPASADFITPLEMMELSCRAFSSLEAFKTAESAGSFNSVFDWTYRQCIWRKSMMGLMIWKSSLVWYSSSYTISFRGIFMDFQETRNPGAERRFRRTRLHHNHYRVGHYRVLMSSRTLIWVQYIEVLVFFRIFLYESLHSFFRRGLILYPEILYPENNRNQSKLR